LELWFIGTVQIPILAQKLAMHGQAYLELNIYVHLSTGLSIN